MKTSEHGKTPDVMDAPLLELFRLPEDMQIPAAAGAGPAGEVSAIMTRVKRDQRRGDIVQRALIAVYVILVTAILLALSFANPGWFTALKTAILPPALGGLAAPLLVVAACLFLCEILDP